MLCRSAGAELEQIQFLLGHSSVQTTERYLGTKQDLVEAPNDWLGLRWDEKNFPRNGPGGPYMGRGTDADTDQKS